MCLSAAVHREVSYDYYVVELTEGSLILLYSSNVPDLHQYDVQLALCPFPPTKFIKIFITYVVHSKCHVLVELSPRPDELSCDGISAHELLPP